MELEVLRKDIIVNQKKGLPFIIASIIIWGLITLVTTLNATIQLQNLLIFCCSCPLLPLSWLVGKWLKVDIFSKENPLSQLGFLVTCNQLIYLLIVMWVYSALPAKMLMVYAMVFGAHLLPYSWLYKSKIYLGFSIFIPILALVLGHVASMTSFGLVMVVVEFIFAVLLEIELKKS
ncbi:DUF7010 family protein [Streptococcus sp. UBA4344]|uniref:DUF7010 family protein n=1 Tax=Streptococcus sp. UBA4344 TaxID=1947564 RepID=UPI00257FF6F8|nr:hypothetical protein [Streptococcus sp. UBA4344]